MGQITEPKTEVEKTAQTPRENRIHSREERDEKPQIKAITAKSGTQKQKEKTHPEIAATQIETVDTWISTRSREKEQQEEKSPEILAERQQLCLLP